MSGSPVKEILVTGASSGIGMELARQLAGPGKRLWLVARSEDKLRVLAGEIQEKGGAAEVLPLDLSDIEGNAAFLAKFLGEVSLDELDLAAAVSIFGTREVIMDSESSISSPQRSSFAAIPATHFWRSTDAEFASRATDSRRSTPTSSGHCPRDRTGWPAPAARTSPRSHRPRATARPGRR